MRVEGWVFRFQGVGFRVQGVELRVYGASIVELMDATSLRLQLETVDCADGIKLTGNHCTQGSPC